ncbi:MAG: peptidoglycan/xylan/chitin deacetylase (PgdA/CDA1 family) [Enterobacterales bacterium]|jgi:peptidoglycan/xylan/chitin deacetylase (PgdA/CDA1 family)
MTNNKIKIALTFDDAPSINEENITFRPERMDKVIEILLKNKISHCTAFVIGKYAIGHEAILLRWLDAGFQLGNHTFYHDHCSQLSDSEFEKTVLKCHTVLESVDAFSIVDEKWFRFPYLEAGINSSQRKKFKEILSDLGYKIAHASISFNDHQYERPLENAIKTSPINIKRVSKRYLNNVAKAVHLFDKIYKNEYGYSIEHIAYAHFGGISENCLDQLLMNLGEMDIEWSTLNSASKCNVYSDFETNNYVNGLIISMQNIPYLTFKFRRKLFRLSQKLNLFQQSKYGPKWPYLE